MAGFKYLNNDLKSCPRCGHSMRYVIGNGERFWNCSNCHLMILDTGEMADWDGDVSTEDTYSWPIDELT